MLLRLEEVRMKEQKAREEHLNYNDIDLIYKERGEKKGKTNKKPHKHWAFASKCSAVTLPGEGGWKKATKVAAPFAFGLCARVPVRFPRPPGLSLPISLFL